MPADLTEEPDVERLFETTLSKWGRVDGLVCNAAALELGAQDGPITEIGLEAWDGIIRADLTTVFLSAKHGIRAMLAGDGGSVLLIASMAAVSGVNGMDGYTAAKGAQVALARSISSYYGRYNIRCNCLAVGFVDSGSDRLKEQVENPDFIARVENYHLGLVGTPNDVAATAAHLLSSDSRYVAGVTISVDGGATAASHLARPSAPDLAGVPRKRQGAPSC